MSDVEKTEPVRVVDRRWWARGESAADAEAVTRKPTVVEDLEQRLADTTAQLQALVAEHRRSADEFEQARVRMRREVARDVERGRRAVLAELLEVVDNLDRAVAAAPSGSEATLARGVEMVRDQFLAKLEAFGVVRLTVLGEPFDAARHEAISTAPVTEPGRDGIVIAVLKEGYAIGDEILRPASVVVGAHG